MRDPAPDHRAARLAMAWAAMLCAMLLAAGTPPPSGAALHAHARSYMLIVGLGLIAVGLMESLRQRRIGLMQAGAIAAATWLPLQM
jgi:hypothetical protein